MTVSRSWCGLLAVVLAGCASKPEYAPFTAIPRDASIHVQPFSGIAESGPPPSRVGERAFEGGGTGAVVGAQAGLEMGLDSFDGCGEFFLVCLGLVPVMGAVGLVGGVAVGSVAGAMEDFPYQRTEAMQEVISGYFEEKSPNRMFTEQFIELASNDWRMNPSADNRVTVAVIGLRPKKERGNTLVFEITTAMTVDYGADDLPPTKPYQFTEATAAYGIEDWIFGGQALYANEVEAVFGKAATVFVSLLKDPPRPRNG